jgi:hypothetical protein
MAVPPRVQGLLMRSKPQQEALGEHGERFAIGRFGL